MNKITKQIENELKQIASALPTVFMDTVEYHYLTGRELNEMDIFKDDQGKDLNPDLKYKWPMPVQIAKNHYRALAKAFRKGGEKDVIHYIREVKSLPAA